MGWTILIAVLLTSALSGVFGMGGGLLLMAVYATLLPGPAAMVLHGLTQLFSNAARAWLLREHVVWPVALRYLAGTLIASACMGWIGLVVDGRAVLIGLGVLPLLSLAIPRSLLTLDLERRAPVVAVGALAGVVQLLCGVSGPLLDLVFLRSRHGRHAIVGTKAAIQVTMHAVKVVYFVLLARSAAWDPSLSPLLLLPILIVAAAGTRLGRSVLDRLGDGSFRTHADRLLVAIGLLLLARGVLG